MTDEQTGDTPPDATLRPPLTRSSRHRVVAGVCGGLGRHLDIDPVVFRVVVAVLCLTGGIGLFLYGLAWLIVPREAADGAGSADGRPELQRVLTGQVDGQSIGAVLLTVIGTGVFFSSMGDGGQFFPVVLLAGLVFMAVRHDPERRRARGPARPPWPDGRDEPLRDAGENVDWRTWRKQFGADMHSEWQARKAEMHDALRLAREHAAARAAGTVPADTPMAGPSGYLWDPRHPERNPYGAQPPPPPGAPAPAWWQRTDLPEGDPLRKAGPPAAVRHSVRPHRHGSGLCLIGLLLAAGAGTLVRAVGGPQVRLSVVLAVALGVLGLAILVGAKFGRARGLALPALLLTVVLAGTGASGVTTDGTLGNRTWSATTVADLQRDYTLGVGNVSLDLTGLTAPDAEPVSRARLGIGELTVTLPADMAVRLTVRSALGDISLPNGEHLSGANNRRTLLVQPSGGRPAQGTLDLDLTVGIGDLQVLQG